jgi:Ca2+/Na+ antiporter
MNCKQFIVAKSAVIISTLILILGIIHLSANISNIQAYSNKNILYDSVLFMTACLTAFGNNIYNNKNKTDKYSEYLLYMSLSFLFVVFAAYITKLSNH